MNTKIIVVFISVCLFAGFTSARPGGKRSGCGRRSNPCKDTLSMVKKGLSAEEIKTALVKTAEERSKGKCDYGYGYQDDSYYTDYYYEEYYDDGKDYYTDDYYQDYYPQDYYGEDYYGEEYYDPYYGEKDSYYQDYYGQDYYDDKEDSYGYVDSYYGDKDKDDYYSDYYSYDYYYKGGKGKSGKGKSGKGKSGKGKYGKGGKSKNGKGKTYFAKAEQKSDPAPVADVVATETPVVETPAAAMVKRQVLEDTTPIKTSTNSVEQAADKYPTVTMTIVDASEIPNLIAQFLQAVNVAQNGSETRGTTMSSEEILKKCSSVRAPNFQRLIKAIQKITSSSA